MSPSSSGSLASPAVDSRLGSLGSGQIGITGAAPLSWIFMSSEFAKGLHRPDTLSAVAQGGLHRPDTLSVVAQGGLHRPKTMSTTLTYSKEAKQDEVLPVNLLCPRLLLRVLQIWQSTLGQC